MTHLDKAALRKTFLELIAIDSPHPHEDGVKTYIYERFNKSGIEVQEDVFGNMIARIEGEGEPLLLNTHMDIPEPTPHARYVERGDIIEADGQNILGADPKTGLAVLLEFALHLAKDSPRAHRPIELVFTRGEEVGLVGASHLDINLLKAREGIVLDEDGPPSQVVIQAPGFIKVDVIIQGKAVHPREPEIGVNALRAACDALHTLPWGYSTDGVTWNIGLFEAGTARNTVPGNAQFQAELRSFDTYKLVEESKRIDAELQTAIESAGARYESTFDLIFEGYRHNTSSNLFKNYEQALKEHGLTPNYFATFGGSDANIFNTRGIETLTIGSGYYDAHQYNEKANLQEMVQCSEVLRHLVKV